MFLTALCSAVSAGTIYVAGDGSGTYNCDGVDDQIEINNALQYAAANPGTIVHLKGPFTYTISKSLYIGSDTILEGDNSAVLKLADNAGWKTWTPLIGQINARGNNNITIQGFTINVNYINNNVGMGNGYYNAIQLKYCSNVNINNMNVYDSAGDCARLTDCTNIKFYNNRVADMGHDGLFVTRCDIVEAWNNNISCRDNSGLRVWNSNHVSFHDNLILGSTKWKVYCGPGIQLEKSLSESMSDIKIYNNTVRNVYGPAIWIIGYGQSHITRSNDSVLIYHNIFSGNGLHTKLNWVGGVVIDGFHNVSILENVFYKNKGAAVLGMQVENGFIPLYYNCQVTVKDNIIANSIPAGYSSNSGYGIENRFSSHCDFSISNNCIYGNTAGAYKDVNYTSDIYADPLFVNAEAGDFRLQANSPMKKLIGVPIGFQGYIGSSGGNGYYSSFTIAGFVDGNVSEATTQDIYNFRDYLAEPYAGKYKNLTTAQLGGRFSSLQYNNPVIALLTTYASLPTSNATVTEYIPSIIRGGMITDGTSGGNGSVIYNMNNVENSTITNYNNCDVTNNITNINIDSHDKHIDSHDTYYYDSHDTYYNNTTINYYNNTTVIYYYGSPDPATVNTTNSTRREIA